MKAEKYYLVILLLSSSCSMLKRTSTEINKESLTALQESKKKMNSTLDSSVRTDYLSLNKISDQSTFQMKLWPKGKIIYHSMDSFEGEFDSIRMTGSLHKKTDIATRSSKDSKLKKINNTVSEQYAKLKTAEKIKQKNSVPDLFALLLVAALLLISSFLLANYLKKRVRS